MKTYIEELEERNEELQSINTNILDFINSNLEFTYCISQHGKQIEFYGGLIINKKASERMPLATATKTKIDDVESWLLEFGGELGKADSTQTIDDIIQIIKKKLNISFAEFKRVDNGNKYNPPDIYVSNYVCTPYKPIHKTI